MNLTKDPSATAESAPGVVPTGTQAVDRAARLLIEIVDAPSPPSFSELAALTGLAKSTTSRLLLALERSGLARRHPNGAYEAGELFLRYAGRGGRDFELVELSRPHLERLGDATGETANVGVSRRGQVEPLDQVDGRYLIGTRNWVGMPVPLHASALGKVLLAYGAASLPPGRLARATERTITRRQVLAEELAEVRRLGYAVSIDELEDGLVAVATPVFRSGGAAFASLSVSGPTSRLSNHARLAEIAVLCKTEAAALSVAFGHRPSQEGAA